MLAVKAYSAPKKSDMKKNIILTLLLILLGAGINSVHAQSEEERNKIQMVIDEGGQKIIVDLNNISTTMSGYSTAYAVDSNSTTGKKVAAEQSDYFYLSMEVKKIEPSMMKILFKRDARFDGTITVTDTYGKNPVRIIKFKQAKVSNYSDQISRASYNDAYSMSALSVSCNSITIDGVVIAP
ncbi:hypothetical protein GJU39_18870 [Pedobacter petrophilus]|uniref:Uncharacterized protein n=1 Tax=Pedobacter petrophilus TaxID=1908241 RepID=A0A7K0G570_9SPHI|nr:hypothetical protein [Pedobacter petrophilus]MRX78146.1 hypothetical protein [Pedobacter petrophilus]